MRERTTWNREAVLKSADSGKTAEDPRAMNQDHLQQQPAADKYLINTGTPSEFAEDVHPSGQNWKAEQDANGTKRDEIGLPEMRGDTFNHPEKAPGSTPSRGGGGRQASQEGLVKKADVCVQVARGMLPKDASEQSVEDQAVSLMNIPDPELIETANRLAGVEANQQQDDDKQSDDDDDDKDKQAAQQQDDDKQSDDDDDKQDKEAGKIPPQFLENVKKKQDEAKAKQNGDDDKGQQKGQQQKGQQKGQQQDKDATAKQAEEVRAAVTARAAEAVTALASGNQEAAAAAIAQMVEAALSNQQQPQVQQGNQQEQIQQGMQQPQQIQQGMQQPEQVQQGNQQQPQQGMQQQPEQATGYAMEDDQMLDQMLMDQAPPMGQPGMEQPIIMADQSGEQEIQIEGAQMDVGETVLGPEDATLQALFASHKEVQQAQAAVALETGVVPEAIQIPQQPVQVPTVTAGMTRTAATRTVGTQPTGGVSAIGGGAPTGGPSDVDKLSNLWNTAPDVSAVFNTGN